MSSRFSLLSICLFCCLYFLSQFGFVFSAYSSLQCSLCISSLDEIEYAVEQTKEEFDVQTKWRVDDKRKIPYKRTEFRIMEIMEKEISNKFPNYGLCAEKDEKSGKIIKRYCREDWRFGNYSKLSKVFEKDMKERYEELIEEHMEEITLAFHRAKNILEIKQQICVETAKLCRKFPEYAKTSTASPNPNAPPPFVEEKIEQPKENETTQTENTQTTTQTTETETTAATGVESTKDEL